MTPDQIASQRRQVAVDAERHFWVTRSARLRDDLGLAGAEATARGADLDAAHALLDASLMLDSLIRQRTT